MPLDNFGISSEKGKAVLARCKQPDKIACDALKALGMVSGALYKLNQDSEYPDHVEKMNWGGEVILDPYPKLFKIPPKQTILNTIAAIKVKIDAGVDVIVHCTHGVDRTGLIIGAYHIVYEGWSFNQVQAERDNYGASAVRDIIDFAIVGFLKDLSNEYYLKSLKAE